MAHAQFMSNQPRHQPEFPTLLQVAFSRSVTEGVNDSKQCMCVANRLHDKQTVGLPRGVACLAITLLVGPTFLHITILSRVKSVKMRQSEHAPPLLSALSSSKGVKFLAHVGARQSCLCWESDLLSRDYFSLYKRDLKLRTAMSGQLPVLSHCLSRDSYQPWFNSATIQRH